MTDRVAGFQVNPHLGLFLPGWIRDEHERIPVVHRRQMPVASPEDRPMNRGSELARAALRELRPGLIQVTSPTGRR
jgi:hypothetical protein